MRPSPSRRASGWFAGTLAFVAAFWLLDLVVLRAGTPDPLDDSWEYGVVARALLGGHGFRTPVIHPPLWTLRDAANTVPVLVHGPLLPILLAPILAVFGPGAFDHLAWLSALFAGVAAMFVYRLGERAHSQAAGAAAAGLFTLAPLTINAVHHDIALTLGALLLAVALDQLFRKQPHVNRAAIALGLGMLVRPEFVLALPLLAPVAGASLWRFVLVSLAFTVPWALHTILSTGSPFFNLSSYLLIGYWGTRPGISVMRDFALPPAAWPNALISALPSLVSKWLNFLPHAVKRFLLTPAGGTGWLAPLGLLFAVQGPRGRLLATTSAALSFIPLVIMTVTLYDARYLMPFMAVFALGAATGASEMSGWLPGFARRPRAWMGLLLLMTLPSTGPALHDAWSGARDARTRLAAERAGLLALGARPPGGPVPVVVSDTPDFVAFTLHRSTLWLTRAEYDTLPAWDGRGDIATAFHTRLLRTPGDVTWFHAADGRGSALPQVSGAASAAGDSLKPEVRHALKPVHGAKSNSHAPHPRPHVSVKRHGRR